MLKLYWVNESLVTDILFDKECDRQNIRRYLITRVLKSLTGSNYQNKDNLKITIMSFIEDHLLETGKNNNWVDILNRDNLYCCSDEF